ncbi:MAG: caspase family protein [Verrucomicrobiales bacterium]
MKSHVFFTACRSLLMVAFSALPGWAALHAQDRVALVIGNNDYDEGGNFPDLDNCVHDAALIKDTLEAVHFKVFFLENATRSQMDETLESFESSITKGAPRYFILPGMGLSLTARIT